MKKSLTLLNGVRDFKRIYSFETAKMLLSENSKSDKNANVAPTIKNGI